MEIMAEIRGMHFYPPAKVLVELLPTGTELVIVREPENPYDPNALQVWLPWRTLPELALRKLAEAEEKLQGFGWDNERLAASPQVMLGHVAREVALLLSPDLDAQGLREVKGSFMVSGKGKPMVRLEREA